jgi:hypothetical protein
MRLFGSWRKMSTANKTRLIRAARAAGMSDADILKEVFSGEYGSEHRRTLVVKWGELLGLTASESLRLAHAAGLIPSAHPPRGAG